MVEAKGLGLAGAFRHVDLTIHAGEIVGIAGVVGSGREEVTRAIGGFLPHSEGTLKIKGETVRFASPEQAVRKGIGYVPRERRVEGLVMFLSIAENISLADLKSVMRGGAISYREERRLASRLDQAPAHQGAGARTWRAASSAAATSRRWCWRAG